MCYKIHHQLIAIESANYYTAGGSRTRGNHRLRQINAKKDTYQHSFFPRSIREWNQVPSSVVDAGSLEDFKVRLNSIPWLSSRHRYTTGQPYDVYIVHDFYLYIPSISLNF
jgi:hypothetical protein